MIKSIEGALQSARSSFVRRSTKSDLEKGEVKGGRDVHEMIGEMNKNCNMSWGEKEVTNERDI